MICCAVDLSRVVEGVFQQLFLKIKIDIGKNIEQARARTIGRIQPHESIAMPANLEEQALILVGRDIYTALIKGYTEKQWGRECSQLPAFIIRRLPLRFAYDNNYFNDTYQGIPCGGYNKLIEGLLRGCDIETNCDFFESRYAAWREYESIFTSLWSVSIRRSPRFLGTNSRSLPGPWRCRISAWNDL